MIFILPSDIEGLSLALLDAMGAGVCVLTSDVPENREAVGGTGFTFQCGNAKDLSERLRFLIASPDMRKKSAQAARSRVKEQYDWDKIANQILNLYFDVLGVGGGGPREVEAIERLAG
jgi:glycosyltransferase involved in cell wall biosynthesis